MRRVVVTGLGMINSVGNDKETAFKAICDGECGIDTITIFDPENFSVKIAGEVRDFDPSTVMAPKEVKKADRFIHLGLKAAQEAMAIAYWRTYNMPIVITNTMNIIGERQDPEKFLPKIIQKVALGEEIY